MFTAYGNIDYPGLGPVESLRFSDQAGISPAVVCIECYPGNQIPSPDGDLTLTYNNKKIVIRSCHLDSVDYDESGGGNLYYLRLLDERWKWQFSSVTLRANQRLPNNFVNPLFEVTPRQLAALCFERLGVKNYDVMQLPNDDRPEVDWDQANAAQELAALCDKYGCRLVPRRSDGSWMICVTGEGEKLPTDLPYCSSGDGVNPREIPDYIKIVTAPFRVQMAVELEPTGKTTGLVWETIDKVAADLAPASRSPFGNQTSSPYNFEPFDSTNIDYMRFTMPDGTKTSKFELAEQYVWKCFRVKDLEPFGKYHTETSTSTRRPRVRENKATIDIPGYDKKVYRKQMILLNELVNVYVDGYGEEHNRPAFAFGIWQSPKAPNGMNAPFGSRIDAQAVNALQTSLEDRRSFSIHSDPIDSDKTIVEFSHKMFMVTNPEAAILRSGPPAHYDFARLWVMCAVQIKSLQTFQPERFEFYYQIGTGTNKDFCHVVIKDDIKPWYIQDYDMEPGPWIDGGTIPLGSLRDNAEEVIKQCKTYAESLAKSFETIVSKKMCYDGWFEIDMDGAIQQVSYRYSKRGFETIASYGSEHNYEQPSYWERRQREGRQNKFAHKQLINEIVKRQSSMRGTINT